MSHDSRYHMSLKGFQKIIPSLGSLLAAVLLWNFHTLITWSFTVLFTMIERGLLFLTDMNHSKAIYTLKLSTSTTSLQIPQQNGLLNFCTFVHICTFASACIPC